jgi:hypothetical protein
VEFDVLEAEGGVVGDGAGVFTGAEEKVECDADEIDDGTSILGYVDVGIGVCEDEHNYDDRDGFDARWGGGWFIFVASEEARDPKVDLAENVLEDVRGPHVGEHLAHRTDVNLHGSSAGGFAFVGNATVPIPLREHLDNGHWIGARSEERVHVAFQGDFSPEEPMCIHRFGAFKSNASAGLFLDKAEINEESISGRGWNICQGIVCGKEESK